MLIIAKREKKNEESGKWSVGERVARKGLLRWPRPEISKETDFQGKQNEQGKGPETMLLILTYKSWGLFVFSKSVNKMQCSKLNKHFHFSLLKRAHSKLLWGGEKTTFLNTFTFAVFSQWIHARNKHENIIKEYIKNNVNYKVKCGA